MKAGGENEREKIYINYNYGNYYADDIRVYACVKEQYDKSREKLEYASSKHNI